MIWLIVFVFICGQIEQFNCDSESTGRKSSFDEQSENDDLYCYELTPSSLDGSQLVHPMINDSTGTLERHNITDDQIGIPFHLIIRLVNARTSKPLVGAYIYVWHVNIHGDYSTQNGVRRSRRSEPSENNFEEFQGKENPPHDRPWRFNHEPDRNRMYEQHSRQDYRRGSGPFPPPSERPEFEFEKAFNQLDVPRSRAPFKPPPFNQSWNDFNETYENSLIVDSKVTTSSYNWNNNTNNLYNDSSFTTESVIFTTTEEPLNLGNFTEVTSNTYSSNESSFTTESVTHESTFNNLTKVSNGTSKDNHTVETHGQQYHANETQRHFLQGYQITDFKGDVSFVTIVPGWIANRSLHVNVHVYLDKSQEIATFVGQLYFPDEFVDKLKSVPMYSQANRGNLTKTYQDEIFKSNNGSSTVLILETIGSGYQSIITLGIDPLKTIKP